MTGSASPHGGHTRAFVRRLYVVTLEEARAIVKDGGEPPVVKWMDKNMRWHYGHLIAVPDRKRARIKGKDRLVPIADLSLYVKPEAKADANT